MNLRIFEKSKFLPVILVITQIALSACTNKTSRSKQESSPSPQISAPQNDNTPQPNTDATIPSNNLDNGVADNPETVTTEIVTQKINELQHMLESADIPSFSEFEQIKSDLAQMCESYRNSNAADSKVKGKCTRYLMAYKNDLIF